MFLKKVKRSEYFQSYKINGKNGVSRLEIREKKTEPMIHENNRLYSLSNTKQGKRYKKCALCEIHN